VPIHTVYKMRKEDRIWNAADHQTIKSKSNLRFFSYVIAEIYDRLKTVRQDIIKLLSLCREFRIGSVAPKYTLTLQIS